MSRKEEKVTEERTKSGRERYILESSGGVIFVGSQEHKAIASVV